LPRLSNVDNHAIASLRAELESLQAGRPFSQFLTAWLASLRGLLGLEGAMGYGVRREAQSFQMDWFAGAGPRVATDQFEQAMQRLIGGGGAWGLFDPSRPEPAQQNRTVVVSTSLGPDGGTPRATGPFDERAVGNVRDVIERNVLARRKLGLEGTWQLRALVCEDGAMLGWIGGCAFEPPRERERRLLDALVPALRVRLSLERLLDRGPLLEAALHATLELVPRAAYVASQAGAVLLANSAGRAELDRHPREVRTAIAEAALTLGRSGPFSATPVVARGRAPVLLLVAHPRDDVAERAVLLARQWELTPRQAEVLEQVARGASNKAIATHLRCAERTVELHITALLDKAGAASRSALIARFFLAG
jgi:DNA-binding CsgD family transcriptional regulator